MSLDLILLLLLIGSGFYMAWSIGANDVANAMGTSVGSGALTLKQAVCIAAVLEFAGAFFFGSHVSATMQAGIVNTSIFENNYYIVVCGMLSALLASAVWLQIASYYGWPVSTTHSIVGAVVGFGILAGGIEAIYWNNLGYIVASWVISPLFGGIFSFIIFQILRRNIFFTQNPLASAKKITPWLVFLVVSILFSILLFNGIHLKMGPEQSLMLTIGLGILSAGICWLLVRRIKLPEAQAASPAYAPEIAIELEKAKKHLDRIIEATDSSVKYRTGVLVEEIDHLASSLKKTSSPDSSEFRAVEKIFGYLQILSACLMAFAHGANDVANAIGPLAAAIGALEMHTLVMNAPIPSWLLALGGLGIVVGLATWGWRVIETIGKRITELTPSRGFSAEFGAAATILIASRLGLPVSTTHTLVGSVLGIGLARGLESLDMSTTRDIVISWIITVPIGAIGAMAFFGCFKYFIGV